MAVDMLAAMNRLRALYNMQNGVGADRSSWGAGGAADQGSADRYKRAINAGMSPQQARNAAIGNQMGGSAVTSPYGSSIGDKELLQWAARNPSPDVNTILSAMNRGGGSGRGARSAQSARGQQGPMSIVEQLYEKYQKAMDDAFAANDARYAEAKGIYEGRQKETTDELRALRERTLGGMEGYGDAQKKLLDQQFAEALANQTASLAAQGLGSVSAAFAGRNAFDLALAKGLLNDRIADRKISQDVQLTNNLANMNAQTSADTASFIERAQDVAPDFNQLANLAMQVARGNYGQGYNQGQGAGGGGAVPMNTARAGGGGGAFMPVMMNPYGQAMGMHMQGLAANMYRPVNNYMPQAAPQKAMPPQAAPQQGQQQELPPLSPMEQRVMREEIAKRQRYNERLPGYLQGQKDRALQQQRGQAISNAVATGIPRAASAVMGQLPALRDMAASYNAGPMYREKTTQIQRALDAQRNAARANAVAGGIRAAGQYVPGMVGAINSYNQNAIQSGQRAVRDARTTAAATDAWYDMQRNDNLQDFLFDPRHYEAQVREAQRQYLPVEMARVKPEAYYGPKPVRPRYPNVRREAYYGPKSYRP